MEFSIKSGNPEKQRSDCLVVGVFDGGKLSASTAALDNASTQAISTIIKTGDMNGQLGSSLLMHNVAGISAKRLLLVGLGKANEFSAPQYLKVVRKSVNALPDTVKSASVFLTELVASGMSVSQKVAQICEVFLDATYQINSLKSKKPDATSLKKVQVFVESAEVNEAKKALKEGLAIAEGVKLAKDLGNLPGNVCTPTYLGKQAKQLAKDYGFKAEVLNRTQIEKLGMGSFLGVAQGSDEPMRLIVLQHKNGKKDEKPVVLVGKGITFDTGGISLKGGADMDEMKYDMCGAASVLGTFKSLGELNLPINAVGIIPTCDNMPSGKALKPGDIVTSMSGQTIEVLNTDAEGRLVLCDALTYMANIGGRPAGSITAACFLSRFAKKYDWAHLDIAGTAWKSGKQKGGTGRPVPLLTTFLMNRANSE